MNNYALEYGRLKCVSLQTGIKYVEWMLFPLNYFVAFCLMLNFPFKLTLSALSAFCILSLLISLVAADFLWAEMN